MWNKSQLKKRVVVIKTNVTYFGRDYMIVIWPNENIPYGEYRRGSSNYSTVFGLALDGKPTTSFGIHKNNIICKPTWQQYLDMAEKMRQYKEKLLKK